MLVITRRRGEQIVFPSLGITVSVVHVRGRTARLGIDAPREIPILRGEVAEQVLGEVRPECTAERDLHVCE